MTDAVITPMSIPEMHARHDEEERQLLRAALAAADWRISLAVEALGVGRSTAMSMVKRLGLEEEYREHSPGRGRPQRKRTGLPKAQWRR